MNRPSRIALALALGAVATAQLHAAGNETIEPASLTAVEVTDAFWAPKLQQWSTTTANDVLNKFEGLHIKDNNPDARHNTLDNFRKVAKGDRDTHNHVHLLKFLMTGRIM